jgi:hypothetical protein
MNDSTNSILRARGISSQRCHLRRSKVVEPRPVNRFSAGAALDVNNEQMAYIPTSTSPTRSRAIFFALTPVGQSAIGPRDYHKRSKLERGWRIDFYSSDFVSLFKR